jgi:hypothetical protein
MKTRQQHNLEICEKLTQFFSDPNHIDLRFFQALSAMDLFTQQYDEDRNVTGIEDPFHKESSKTNKDIINFLNRYETILKHK